MSLHGIVKGRPFEAFVEKMMQGEATGVMMYYALARLAKEQGLDEVSKEFMAIGNEEAFHSGFYAVLKGAYPQDFWNLVRSLQKVEAAGEEKIKAISDEFRAAGLSEAADEMAVFARQKGGAWVPPRGAYQSVCTGRNIRERKESLPLPRVRL